MKFFEDVAIGERHELGSYTFTADGIKAFAVRFDPQTFHVDEAAAARMHAEEDRVLEAIGVGATYAARAK